MAQKLFDKASLVMIPSQYKEGKIYNIKPEDQSSSFEFERGTAATRVNSSGLIEYVGIGAELITDGGFDDASAWGTSGGASVSGGVGVFPTAFSQINQSGIEFINGETYLITFEITSSNSNISWFTQSTSIKGYANYTQGTHTLIYNSSADTSGLIIYSNGVASTIDNVSIKDISNDTPRLDYNGTEPALLLEPQRINIITYSSDTNNWGWGSDSNPNNTTRDFGYSAPDGSNNATLFTRNLGTSGFPAWGNIPTNVNTDFTYSIFVKKGTSDTIELFNVSTSPQSKVIYNFNTNTFTTELNATGKSVAYSDGWYRISMTYANGSATVSQIRNIFEDGKSVYLFGAQAEQGSYATSYIPTNGQTETRLAEGAINGGNASLFNDSEGVLYLEIDYLEETQLISITDGTSNEAIWIYNTSGNIRFYVFNGGVVQCNIVITTYDHATDGFIKIAVKYKQNSFEAYANGVKTQQDTSGNTPTGLNVLKFSRGDGAYTFWPKANVRALYYFSEELTDTELQQLTSNT